MTLDSGGSSDSTKTDPRLEAALDSLLSEQTFPDFAYYPDTAGAELLARIRAENLTAVARAFAAADAVYPPCPNRALHGIAVPVAAWDEAVARVVAAEAINEQLKSALDRSNRELSAHTMADLHTRGCVDCGRRVDQVMEAQMVAEHFKQAAVAAEAHVAEAQTAAQAWRERAEYDDGLISRIWDAVREYLPDAIGHNTLPEIVAGIARQRDAQHEIKDHLADIARKLTTERDATTDADQRFGHERAVRLAAEAQLAEAGKRNAYSFKAIYDANAERDAALGTLDKIREQLLPMLRAHHSTITYKMVDEGEPERLTSHCRCGWRASDGSSDTVFGSVDDAEKSYVDHFSAALLDERQPK